ncbi:MAG TPA: HAD-IA family hydrolase [Methylomirabilota bacterium]|jgi:putative hydrolase of the HAD superfamily|nr:HAD-IA family hydrolase [Methylomirabilota bacterium]
MRRAPIRAVTFDFWGTILPDPPVSDDRHRPRRLADFEAILGAAGVEVSRPVLERAYRDSGAFLAQIWLQDRDVPVEDHVRAILISMDPALVGRLQGDTLKALTEAYARPALLAPPAVDEGARPALEALARRGYTLCVVSNTMRTPGLVLREILRHYGLLGYFAHLTFSDECRVRKPAAEIFRRTLAAVSTPASAAVHVGDDPLLDVEGARSAGMRVIQVTTDRPPWFGRRRPHATIPGLAALPEAIARLDR